eukprot:gene7025-10834_t
MEIIFVLLFIGLLFILAIAAIYNSIIEKGNAAKRAWADVHTYERGKLEVLEPLQQLLPNVEAYPELKASDLYKQLMSEISDQQENVNAAIAIYNLQVERFNNGIQTFPANLVNEKLTKRTAIAPFNDENTWKQFGLLVFFAIEKSAMTASTKPRITAYKGDAYEFPDEDLLDYSVEQLQALIRKKLPLATYQIDGLGGIDQVRVDYAQDLIDQARDLLLDRGMSFTQAEIEELEFLTWPPTESERIERETQQLAEAAERVPIYVSEPDIQAALDHLRALPYSRADSTPRAWDRQRLVIELQEQARKGALGKI